MKKLAQAKRLACSGALVTLMKKLEKEINKLLDKEAQMWGQRAKMQWLKDGDRNFFIAQLHREGGKIILRGCIIIMVNGALIQAEQRTLFQSFYQALFTSQRPDNFDEILAQIPRVVTTEMSNDLLAEFKVDEVETTLKQMAPLKSLRLDVMPPFFTNIIGPWWAAMWLLIFYIS